MVEAILSPQITSKKAWETPQPGSSKTRSITFEGRKKFDIDQLSEDDDAVPEI